MNYALKSVFDEDSNEYSGLNEIYEPKIEIIKLERELDEFSDFIVKGDLNKINLKSFVFSEYFKNFPNSDIDKKNKIPNRFFVFIYKNFKEKLFRYELLISKEDNLDKNEAKVNNYKNILSFAKKIVINNGINDLINEEELSKNYILFLKQNIKFDEETVLQTLNFLEEEKEKIKLKSFNYHLKSITNFLETLKELESVSYNYSKKEYAEKILSKYRYYLKNTDGGELLLPIFSKTNSSKNDEEDEYINDILEEIKARYSLLLEKYNQRKEEEIGPIQETIGSILDKVSFSVSNSITIPKRPNNTDGKKSQGKINKPQKS